MTYAYGQATSHVLVVDDDRSIRDSLSSLFRSVGKDVTVFSSAAQFLERSLPDGPSCIIVDIRLPGMSGLDFHDALLGAGIRIPVVFITGYADVPMAVRAMKAGAAEFLTKPVREQDMLDVVEFALQKDAQRREQNEIAESLLLKYSGLTPREQEILGFVADGFMSKQIAAELGISEITVKVHRSHAMRKMGVSSLPRLVRMMDRIERDLRPRNGRAATI